MPVKHLKLVEMPSFKLIAFPCEAGIGHKTAMNRKEFVKIFNHVNRYSQAGMYNSIYAFETVNEHGHVVPESAIVDKVLIDLDLEDFAYDKFRCWLNMYAIHLFFESINVQHGVNFSGNGYHVYIGVDSRGIEDDDKNAYIISLINFISRIVGVIVCESCTKSPTARIIRTVGSYYIKKIGKRDRNKDDDSSSSSSSSSSSHEEEGDAKDPYKEERAAYKKWVTDSGFSDRYCTSLNDEDIHGGYMAAYAKSLYQEFSFTVMGTKRIVLKSIDKTVESKSHVIDDKKIAEIKKIDDSSIKDVYGLLEKFMIYKKDIPPCMRLLLKNKDARFYERGPLVTWLAMMDLSTREIEIVLKHCLSPYRYNHAYHVEPRSPDYTAHEAQAGNYKIGCASFQSLGYCTEEKCKKRRIFPFLE